MDDEEDLQKDIADFVVKWAPGRTDECLKEFAAISAKLIDNFIAVSTRVQYEPTYAIGLLDEAISMCEEAMPVSKAKPN